MSISTIDELDNVVFVSEMQVLQSICEYYAKVYTIMENCSDDTITQSFDFIQESVADDNDLTTKTGKQTNILGRMFAAIGRFFKSIASAIANFFKKAKTSVTERLGKLDKVSDETCEQTQKIIDDTNSSEGKDYTNAEDKVNDDLDKKIDEKFVDDKTSDNAENKPKKKKTTIHVKEKKIWTHIKFADWERFLEYTDKYLDKLSNLENVDESSIKGLINTRPSRSITGNKLKFEQSQSSFHDTIDDIFSGHSVRESRLKKVKLYSHFSKRVPLNEVNVYIEKFDTLLKLVVNKVNTLSDSFLKISKVVENASKMPNYGGIISDKLMTKLSVIQTELSNISAITMHMMGYLAQELNAYSVLLDVLEPIIDRVEKENKERKK